MLFKEIARDKERGDKFLHKYCLPDKFSLSERGWGQLVKKAFFYLCSGMDPCKYCLKVFSVQTQSGLGESGYVSGNSTSPEPETGIPSNEESALAEDTRNIQEVRRALLFRSYRQSLSQRGD
jgi:hypothetical protein